LADASSVQFTRNPGGIVGALKKIGGLAEGSRIRDAHAEEISHMFFGDAFAGSLFNVFATHPPLDERIRALEPEFDGRFPQVEPLTDGDEAVEKSAAAGRPLPLPIPGFPQSAVGTAYAAMALDAGRVVQHIGRPQAEHLDRAGEMVARIPQPLLDAAREPFSAQAVVYSLLLTRDDETTRNGQLQLLQGQMEPPMFQETQQLVALAQSLPAAARLPLVDLAAPALKKCSPRQYGQFRQVVETLVHADGKVDLFEYCLRMVLFSYLDVHFGLKKPAAIRYRSLDAVAGSVAVILSTLAYFGQEHPEDVERAFRAGTQNLPAQAAILPRDRCTLPTFDAALSELAQASPNVKRAIIAAVAGCVAADGKVTLEESELLRAIAAALACPLPPLITETPI
jgi:hypothetical protein